MPYKVHKLTVGKDINTDTLEKFLNKLQGEVISIFPDVVPKLNIVGATAGYDQVVIVEKVDY